MGQTEIVHHLIGCNEKKAFLLWFPDKDIQSECNHGEISDKFILKEYSTQ